MYIVHIGQSEVTAPIRRAAAGIPQLFASARARPAAAAMAGCREAERCDEQGIILGQLRNTLFLRNTSQFKRICPTHPGVHQTGGPLGRVTPPHTYTHT